MDPEVQQPSFFQKYKFTLISLFIIVLVAIPLLLLSNTASKKQSVKPTQEMTQTVNPSPTIAPLTTQNVEPTLSQTDTDIQNSLNQMGADLQSVNNIDTSQDSTSGL